MYEAPQCCFRFGDIGRTERALKGFFASIITSSVKCMGNHSLLIIGWYQSTEWKVNMYIGMFHSLLLCIWSGFTLHDKSSPDVSWQFCYSVVVYYDYNVDLLLVVILFANNQTYIPLQPGT